MELEVTLGSKSVAKHSEHMNGDFPGGLNAFWASMQPCGEPEEECIAENHTQLVSAFGRLDPSVRRPSGVGGGTHDGNPQQSPGRVWAVAGQVCRRPRASSVLTGLAGIRFNCDVGCVEFD